MAYYNWEKICSNKEIHELIDICSGETPLNFEARKYAYKELTKRKHDSSSLNQLKGKIAFDFNNYENSFDKRIRKYKLRKLFFNISLVLYFIITVVIVISLLTGKTPPDINSLSDFLNDFRLFVIAVIPIALISELIQLKITERRYKREMLSRQEMNETIKQL